MNKIFRYIILIPRRIKQYGYRTMICKIYVDLLIFFGQINRLSPKKRWLLAHQFHTTWKRSQQEMYKLDGYNERIDSKSREVLTEFYEVGLDFQGKTFLDVGCGTRGVLPIITAEKKIGVDPTIHKAKLGYTNDEINVYYLSEKVEEMSLEDESVDIVCCNNTLNHVEDPLIALAQIFRVLKPGGMFLVEVFIEKQNIAHTVELAAEMWEHMILMFFDPVTVKHERLRVKVEIDETMGVFKK